MGENRFSNLLCSRTCCTTIVWSSAWSSDGPRIMPVTDPELCHGTPYAFRRYGCAVSRARTLRCFPPPARVLAPSLLSFRPTLRSSLSAPGRMHEHISADGLRVLRLQNSFEDLPSEMLPLCSAKSGYLFSAGIPSTL